MTERKIVKSIIATKATKDYRNLMEKVNQDMDF